MKRLIAALLAIAPAAYAQTPPRQPATIAVPAPVVGAIVEYLAGRPWAEVNPMMQQLRMAVDEAKRQAEPPAETAKPAVPPAQPKPSASTTQGSPAAEPAP